MNYKKIGLMVALILIIIAIGAAFAFSNNGKNAEGDNGKINIVTTTFATYDFAKQIAGDRANVTFLMGPGVDTHGYDPSAGDLIKIQNADIFIYVGEEMEQWVERVIDTLDTERTTLVKISELVEIIEEQEIEGVEHSHSHEEDEHDDDHEHEEDDDDHEHEEDEHANEVELDEHVWSSPANAIIVMEKLAKVFVEVDSENKEIYETNGEKYVNEIKKLKADIQEIVDNKVRDRLIFGDKMPMQYFINEFGLQVSAAFTGCSTETEPSSSTVAYLINKVKEENLPVVLYIELSNGKIAQTISEETGAQMMQIQTLHNVTKKDFDSGETYVSLMTRNLEVLKKALQ